MDIYFYGQACFKLKGKNATLVIDPFDPDAIGLKLPKSSDLEADALLLTHNHPDHSFSNAVPNEPVLIAGPGEYEVKGVSVIGTSVSHDEAGGAERGKNTVYSIIMDGLNIVHLGDLGHTLSEDQASEIGECDILLVPVGSVYTIDAKKASEVVSSLEPRIIIPMHYALPGLKAPLEGVEAFLKEMGAEDSAPQGKLTITRDKLPEEPEVVVLSKS